MADEGQIGKLKEQYVDDIITIVPLSQACFIVIMVLTYDQIASGSAITVLQALGNFGLKSSLGPDGGRFWSISVLPICAAFLLALVNTYIFQKHLSRSLKIAKINQFLVRWQNSALQKVRGLSDDRKQVIHGSIKPEIETRLRKFKAKRIAVELLMSLMAVGLYANIFIIFLSYEKDFSIELKMNDFVFLLLGIIASLFLHKESISYAIAKVLPLKVYAGVLTGELVFFEEISG
jgi:hypothetical protein